MKNFELKSFTRFGKEYYEVGLLDIEKRIGDQIGLPKAKTIEEARGTLLTHFNKQNEARKYLREEGLTLDDILDAVAEFGCLYTPS